MSIGFQPAGARRELRAPHLRAVLARLQIRYREIRSCSPTLESFANEWTHRFLATAIADLGTAVTRDSAESPV
jgi:hypothetical protein